MDMRRGIGLLLLLAAGCAPKPTPSSTPPPTPAASPAASSDLRAAVPPAPKGFVATVFRERPGLVTVHLKKGDDLAGTFLIADLRAERGLSAESFASAREKVAGYPAVSTAMGGGVRVRVADRFDVEAVSLGPVLPPDARDRWLAAADFAALERLSR